MSGAIATITQPTGVNTPGEAGKARQDLWLTKEVVLSASTTGNTSYEWTLLDTPLNSTATITNDDAPVAGLVPDKIGTYRLLLKVDGGGWGNEVIVLFRVRYSSAGVLENRGWAYPAVGENLGEGDYDTNERSYAEVFETIFEDIRLNGMGGGGGGSATLVFRPGGTEEDNVYITWAALMAAFDATEGLVDILIDDVSGTPVVPDGTWDLENRGSLVGDGASAVSLQIGNGTGRTSLKNPVGFKRLILWSAFADSASISLSGTLVAEDTIFQGFGASDALITVAASLSRIYLRGTSSFGSSVPICDYTLGSGSVSIYLEDTSEIGDDTLACGVGSTIFVFLSNTVVSCSETQTDVAGTLTISAPPEGFTAGGDLTGDGSSQTVSFLQGMPTPSPSAAALDDTLVVANFPASPRALVSAGSEVWVGNHEGGGTVEGIVVRLDCTSGVPPTTSTSAVLNLSEIDANIDGVRDLAIDSNYVYAAGWNGGTIAIISRTTNEVVGWGTIYPTTLNSARAISVAADDAGKFYVIGFDDAGSDYLFRFDTAACIGATPGGAGKVNAEASVALVSRRRNIRYGGGYLWLANGGNDSDALLRHDPSTLASNGSFTGGGYGLSCLYAFGSVWVTDSDTNVYRVNPATMAQVAAIATSLSTPNGIGLGPSDTGTADAKVFVTDKDGNTVSIIDPTENAEDTTVALTQDNHSEIASFENAAFVTAATTSGGSVFGNEGLYKILGDSRSYAASTNFILGLNYGRADVVPNTLVFRPGGTAGLGVYTSWSDLMAAFAETSGLVFIEIDDSITSPANIIQGSWDLESRAVLVGKEYFAHPTLSIGEGFGFGPVELANPAGFKHLRVYSENSATAQRHYIAFDRLWFEDCIVYSGNTHALGYLFDLEDAELVLRGNTQLLEGDKEAALVVEATTSTIYVEDFSSIDESSLYVAGTLNVRLANKRVSCNNSQSVVGGTLNIISPPHVRIYDLHKGIATDATGVATVIGAAHINGTVEWREYTNRTVKFRCILESSSATQPGDSAHADLYDTGGSLGVPAVVSGSPVDTTAVGTQTVPNMVEADVTAAFASYTGNGVFEARLWINTAGSATVTCKSAQLIVEWT